ncbi:cannabinoid receptor type 1A-like [Argopecten irradians]|uniref:cannabinoid receptor type 1A-like n=1 Tax=Argopecten irradians TaxID=31199 RepID=UPI003716ABAA
MASQCNVSANSSDYVDTDTAPTWVSLCVTVSGGITILVNIPAVIAMIITKFRQPKVRMIQLIILGVTDMLAGMSLFPILKTFINPTSNVSYWSCFSRMFFFGITYYNSIGQLCVICIDRYFLLSRPSWRYTTNYERRYIKMFSVMFIITIVAICLPFFILGHHRNVTMVCKLENLFCEDLPQFSAVIGGVAIFIQICIIICCISMIVVLQKHRRKCRQIAPLVVSGNSTAANQSNPEQERQYIKMAKETKSTLTIIIIIANLIICVSPMNLGFIIHGLNLGKQHDRIGRHLFITLTSLNSAINPLIYCFRTPEVKATLQSGLDKFRTMFRM